MELIDHFLQRGSQYARLISLLDIAEEIAAGLGEDEIAEACHLSSHRSAHQLLGIQAEVDARKG